MAAPATKGLIGITGASSGIGLAAAKQLSAEGYSLLLMARRVERMEELGLPNAICSKVDVTDLEAMKKAVAEAEAKFGPIVGLVNNAGVMLLGMIGDQDPKEWDRMLDVNVKGVLNGMSVVVNGMTERKNGTIINVSSIAGFKPFPSHAAYCASKYAVHGMTETVRKECAPSTVRVSLVSPGVVQTELLGHTTSEETKEGYEAWKKGELNGEPLVSEDIASIISYIINAPKNVCIRELVVAAVRQVE